LEFLDDARRHRELLSWLEHVREAKREKERKMKVGSANVTAKLEIWREVLARGCVSRTVDFAQSVDASEVVGYLCGIFGESDSIISH
jgi:hypothetical protein